MRIQRKCDHPIHEMFLNASAICRLWFASLSVMFLPGLGTNGQSLSSRCSPAGACASRRSSGASEPSRRKCLQRRSGALSETATFHAR